jgi:membrane-bound inhibitor of C-type lysozyme
VVSIKQIRKYMQLTDIRTCCVSRNIEVKVLNKPKAMLTNDQQQLHAATAMSGSGGDTEELSSRNSSKTTVA